jgi:hypothetical protein
MSMPAPIVVDVGVAEPQRDLASALVDACSQAAASASIDCRLVRDTPNGPYTAIAIVTWEEGDRARVEVGLRREPTSEWRTRELTFQAADADIERYRSVGFVIGSLATAARDDAVPKSAASAPQAGATKPEPPPAKAAPARPATPPPTKPVSVAVAPPSTHEPAPPHRGPSRPRQYGWLGLTAGVGGGLDRGAARWGGQAWAGVRILPHVAAIASGGAWLRPRDDQGLRARWIDAGLGIAALLGPSNSVHLDVRGQALLESFTAHAERDGATDQMNRLSLGGRFGADGVLPLGDVVDLVLGADMTFRPATKTTVAGHSAGATRNAELGASAGLRFEL